jgi:hypothetical protein
MTVSLDRDPAAFIETALNEVCFGDEDRFPLAATLDRYFSPDYQQRTDGEVLDRDGFAAHLRAVRGLTAAGRIEVREVVVDGRRFADRHEVTVTRRDGTTSRLEIYLFGELAADGRLRRVDEISRVLDGDARDAELARAH